MWAGKEKEGPICFNSQFKVKKKGRRAGFDPFIRGDKKGPTAPV